LAGIEKRWEGMPPQEQAALWMQLRDRMKVDWHEMTLQEKKAGMLKSYTQGIALNVALMHLQLA
jgi:Cytochrome c oxidase subunit IV